MAGDRLSEEGCDSNSTSASSGGYAVFPVRRPRIANSPKQRCLRRGEQEDAQVPFPETPRVVYEKNTLEEAKCQIRFPPILAIEASVPVDFQEAVRGEFPYFDLKTSVRLPDGVPPHVAKVVQRDLSLVGGKSYVFSSEDRNWIIELRKDGLSWTCRSYGRWEAFREHLKRALASLADIYRPSFFTHTCIRYKNAIRRVPLGLETTTWCDLLQPWTSGPLGMPETADGVEAIQNRCVIRLPNDADRVDANFAIGVHQPSGEQAFIIEAHVYNDARKELNDVLPRLDVLHQQAAFFFRWCITDELHRAMRPSPV
ncbi:MAG: TIGR04255 family protein [Planctomycetota bacterium]|nr:TIGR04255 family protein [Planctomycetota bacterium]